MAEFTPPTIDNLYFPALVAGAKASAPPRTMGQPQSPFLWRDALNMIARDGATMGRPGFVGDAAAQPTITVPVGLTPSVVTLPRWMYYDGTVTVLVTTSEIWVNYAGTWRNCTPTYAVGTISATNGNTAITGAGTLWRTRGIAAGVIRIDSTDYYVTTNSDTTATLGGAYQGATGAGKAYSIRRVFSGYDDAWTDLGNAGDIYATIYNGDLYVAANLAYLVVASPTSTSAVIKVAGIYSTSPTTTYLTAGDDLTGTLDYIAGLPTLVGIAALQDGRIVIAGGSLVYYSSHLDTAVWTVAPGGNTPLAEAQGNLTAMGRVGATLTLHHQRGIIRADPTGLSDPPLRYEATSAEVGAVAPHTVRPFRGGEAYLAADCDVKFFDGTRVMSLGDHEIGYRLAQLMAAEGLSSLNPKYFWSWVNPRRDEYTLFRVASNGSSATKFWTYQADSDRWWPCETALVLGAMAALTGSTVNSNPNQAALGGSVTSTSPFLSWYREGSSETVSTPTYYLETDDLDHGQPLALKTPQRVVVWPVATMSSLVVSVRTIADSSYTFTVTDSPNLATVSSMCFDFMPGQASAIPASIAHRYKLSGTTLRLGVSALLIRAAIGGDGEGTGP